MSAQSDSGSLWLVPTPIGDDADPLQCLPRATQDVVCRLDYLIAENARSARSFLKHFPLVRPIQSIEIRELNEHTPEHELPGLLAPLLAGRDGGILSEAGCPAVADPGASLVALAHSRGVRVRPLIGPSSLLLALMAGGLGGQRFAFVGYLPQAPEERLRAARELEIRSARHEETILMIETPYRNQALADTLIAALAPGTLLSIASAISLADERITTRSVAEWRQVPPILGKTPAVFSILAHAGPGAKRGPQGSQQNRSRSPSATVRRS